MCRTASVCLLRVLVGNAVLFGLGPNIFSSYDSYGYLIVSLIVGSKVGEREGGRRGATTVVAKGFRLLAPFITTGAVLL